MISNMYQKALNLMLKYYPHCILFALENLLKLVN